MTVTWCTPGVAGLGHKRSAEKSRTVDSSVGGGGGGSSGVMNAARLEGQAVCKTERLQAISTPLGPYDKNYSRKRIREHSLERADCELHVCSRDCFNLRSHQWTRLTFPFFLSFFLPASPKLFMDSSTPCTTLANMHSSLHSPLTRQLSTSSENSVPLGLSSQSVPSTPVRTPPQISHLIWMIQIISPGFLKMLAVFFFKQALLQSYILLMTFIYFSSCVEIWWFHMTQDDKHSIKKMCSRESLRRGVCGKAVL